MSGVPASVSSDLGHHLHTVVTQSICYNDDTFQSRKRNLCLSLTSILPLVSQLGVFLNLDFNNDGPLLNTI